LKAEENQTSKDKVKKKGKKNSCPFISHFFHPPPTGSLDSRNWVDLRTVIEIVALFQPVADDLQPN
jgi:hypothetical protein